MKKISLLLVFMAVFSLVALPQRKSLETITAQELRSSMTFFASDELEGRRTASLCNEAAALYLKSNLMMLGISPIPTTGDYVQDLPLVSCEIIPGETNIKVLDTDNREVFTSDSVLFLNGGVQSAEFNGDVVFAGYGYSDKETGYNDFEGIDPAGKIVIIMTKNPKTATAPGNPQTLIDASSELEKIWSLSMKKPKAILYVYNPSNIHSDPYKTGISYIMPGGNGMSKILSPEQASGTTDIPVAFITRHTANLILKSAGTSLESAEKKILETSQPNSFTVPGLKASLGVSVSRSETGSSNVIGIIEGSDPILKEECIVYSAHFDHNGRFGDRGVFNGADDNASGSMALLELAEAYMSLKKKPARTIIFAWFTGEEQGLLGSGYYAEHPVMPLENTLLNINLDMIGRSPLPGDTENIYGEETNVAKSDEVYVVTAHECCELDDILSRSAQKTGLEVTDIGPALKFGSSDHQSFKEKNVPVLFFTTGMHPDYHYITDDVEKIDFNKLEKITKMVFLIGYEVADREDRIRVDKEAVMKF